MYRHLASCLVFKNLLSPLVDLDYVYCFSGDDCLTSMTSTIGDLVQSETYLNMAIRAINEYVMCDISLS